MKKYKLINKITQEEVICTKVTIDSFDYYVSNGELEYPSFHGYVVYAEQHLFYSYGTGIWTKQRWDKDAKLLNTTSSFIAYKKVIATNNPNIDIPKVIDEVEELASETYTRKYTSYKVRKQGFKTGYNKHKEDNPFSEEDLKELLEFLTNEKSQYSIMYGNQKERFATEDKDYTIEQFIELWKEQKLETVYFK